MSSFTFQCFLNVFPPLSLQVSPLHFSLGTSMPVCSAPDEPICASGAATADKGSGQDAQSAFSMEVRRPEHGPAESHSPCSGNNKGSLSEGFGSRAPSLGDSEYISGSPRSDWYVLKGESTTIRSLCMGTNSVCIAVCIQNPKSVLTTHIVNTFVFEPSIQTQYTPIQQGSSQIQTLYIQLVSKYKSGPV